MARMTIAQSMDGSQRHDVRTGPNRAAQRAHSVDGFEPEASLGIEKVKTPHLDRFAREGARFTNALSNTPSCTPARATLLTGKYAITHGLVTNDM